MTTIWLPEDLVSLVDTLKEERKDPTRSDTVRFLLLRALAGLGYLEPYNLKALGLTSKNGGGN